MHVIRKVINLIRWFFGILFIIGGFVGVQVVLNNSDFFSMILYPVGIILFGVSLLPIIWRILSPHIKCGKNIFPIIVPIICIILTSLALPYE